MARPVRRQRARHHPRAKFRRRGRRRLDRELHQLGIPVALSLHIESVGAGGRIIPDNVEAAANFFQREGWALRGQSEILARSFAHEDRRKLRVPLARRQIDESGENWARRDFLGTHLKMENAPWDAVRKTILEYVER